MVSDPQWFANDIAVVVAAISVGALVISVWSLLYARRQTKAAEAQAAEASASRQLTERAMADQADALKIQAQDTARA